MDDYVPVRHGFYGEKDDDGWWSATCPCGWAMGPFPDVEDAADAYGDHRASTAVAEWEASR